MDPRLLRTFVTVAELGTVSEAAHTLNTVQSALSRQLQRLQRDLGLELFVRSGSHLVLSPAGTAFLPVAQRVLREHRAAQQAAEILAGGRLRTLAIAASGTTLIDVIIPFVATEDEDHTRIQVTELALDASLEDAVAEHDLVVLPSAPPATVSSLPLRTLPVWAYVSRTHPWAHRGEVPLAELAEQRLVLPTRAFKSRRVFDGALEVAGLRAGDVTEVNAGAVAQALVATGAGVAVVTEDPAVDVVPLRIRADSGLLSIWLHAVWRTEHYGAAQLERTAHRLHAFMSARYP
ncbi:MAG: LysR family transcriptional regulator [Micrococcus sp.]|nr:LysR family transcriptional regulator [Micrococcus sp.]